MNSSQVIYERQEYFSVVRLNRPEKLNALSREMLLALTKTFQEIRADPRLRAVILTGTGNKAFCAGTDIAELDGVEKEGAREASRRGLLVCELIENCGVPVIAAINGLAAGGGCELALASHLRLAAKNATFSLPETKLGLIPGYGGTQRLAREIGRGRALEILLSGRSLAADEALKVGLVSSVMEIERLPHEAELLALEIAQLAPLGVRACIEAVTRGLELPLEEGLALETELFASLIATNDMREGTRAFLEKRSPVFTGT